MSTVDIMFESKGAEGLKTGAFVGAENSKGESISLGVWVTSDEFHILRIQEPPLRTKVVYVVIQNKDLTEGRGPLYPGRVCELRETAVRLSKGKDVQGTDCAIEESLAVFMEDVGWLARVVITPPTREDTREHQKQELRNSAIERMKEAGISADDIRIVMYSKER